MDKKLRLKLLNKERDFCFPDEGNTAAHIHNILTGKIYPVVQLKNFSPTQIIDVGANVGAAAIYFHDKYPSAQITCFEPCSKSVKYLSENLSNIEHTTIKPYGLLDKSQNATLLAGKSQCLQHSIFTSVEVSESGEKIQIEDAFAEIESIANDQTLLKVDTEGCEFQILSSVKQLFNQLQVIYLEFHSEKDRTKIDELLNHTHGLCRANVSTPHRGDLCYIHRSLWENDSEISQWEISSE